MVSDNLEIMCKFNDTNCTKSDSLQIGLGLYTMFSHAMQAGCCEEGTNFYFYLRDALVLLASNRFVLVLELYSCLILFIDGSDSDTFLVS